MAYTSITKSAANAQAILNQPGRIVVAPTDLSAAFPYGGDYLGHFDGGLQLQTRPSVHALTCPDQRPYPYLYVWSGWEEITGIGVAREWNQATVQMAFPGMTKVSGTERKIQFPGSLRGLMNPEATKLIFVPDETDHESIQWAVYFRVAVPLIGESMALAFGYNDPTRLPLVWRFEPDQSHGTEAEEIGVIDRLANISL